MFVFRFALYLQNSFSERQSNPCQSGIQLELIVDDGETGGSSGGGDQHALVMGRECPCHTGEIPATSLNPSFVIPVFNPAH